MVEKKPEFVFRLEWIPDRSFRPYDPPPPRPIVLPESGDDEDDLEWDPALEQPDDSDRPHDSPTSNEDDINWQGPRRRVVRIRFGRTADAPLNPNWALDLRKSWDRMGLSDLAPLPAAILSLYGRPTPSGREAERIVGQVIRTAREGFRLLEASIGRSSGVTEETSGAGSADTSISPSSLSINAPETPAPEKQASLARYRAVDAYDVGRLWNRLRFDRVQAWFEREDFGHREQAYETAGELGRRARPLKETAAERQRIQRDVTDWT